MTNLTEDLKFTQEKHRLLTMWDNLCQAQRDDIFEEENGVATFVKKNTTYTTYHDIQQLTRHLLMYGNNGTRYDKTDIYYMLAFLAHKLSCLAIRVDKTNDEDMQELCIAMSVDIKKIRELVEVM